ncbi:hypothetical protein IWX47DRAFT_333723 [Phyllosticta citricarpa]
MGLLPPLIHSLHKTHLNKIVPSVTNQPVNMCESNRDQFNPMLSFTHAELELNRSVINSAICSLKRANHLVAANWLQSTVNLCHPNAIIVRNTSSTFHRILKTWRTATMLDPSIRERGTLVYRAFKNGDRAQPFNLSDEEAYDPETHAQAAMRSYHGPSPCAPQIDSSTIFEHIPPVPTLPGQNVPRSPSPLDLGSRNPTKKEESRSDHQPKTLSKILPGKHTMPPPSWSQPPPSLVAPVHPVKKEKSPNDYQPKGQGLQDIQPSKNIEPPSRPAPRLPFAGLAKQQESPPAGPQIKVSYTATIDVAGTKKSISFTEANKDEVMETIKDYTEFCESCKGGGYVEYDTFVRIRNFKPAS